MTGKRRWYLEDPEEIFSAAENARESGRNWEAVELYLAAAKRFEESRKMERCASAYEMAGLLLESLQRNSEALEYFNKAVSILESLCVENERLAFNLSHAGFNYFLLEEYGKAAESYLRSARIYEERKLFRDAAESYWRAGFSYKQSADYLKAEECYKKSLKLSEETGNKYQQAVVLGLLGILYGDAMNRHEEAARLYLKSGELFRELGDVSEARDKYVWAFQSYLNAGMVEMAEKLMDSINKNFPENGQQYYL